MAWYKVFDERLRSRTGEVGWDWEWPRYQQAQNPWYGIKGLTGRAGWVAPTKFVLLQRQLQFT
jgi:hypothetical protein